MKTRHKVVVELKFDKEVSAKQAKALAHHALANLDEIEQYDFDSGTIVKVKVKSVKKVICQN